MPSIARGAPGGVYNIQHPGEGTRGRGRVPPHPTHGDEGTEIFPDPAESHGFEEAVCWIGCDPPSMFQPSPQGVLRLVMGGGGAPPQTARTDVCLWMCEALHGAGQAAFPQVYFCKALVKD